MCKQDSVSEQSTKIYTRKELMMIETTISNFHTSFLISAIQKLAFYIPRVKLLGTNHCGDSRRNAFKLCESFQDVLCYCDYSESVVASFAHEIKSEYYGENISVSLEVIVLEHSSALPQTGIKSSTKSFPRHEVLYYFLSDDSKQYALTTTSHSKHFIELLKNKNY